MIVNSCRWSLRSFSFWCPAGHSWQSLNVPESIHRALVKSGYPAPTMAQSLAIRACRENPSALHLGMQTGTGKTLAFLIPILERLQSRSSSSSSGPALLIAPSLELCHQISSVCDRLLAALSPDIICAHVQPLMIPATLNQASILVTTPTGAERIIGSKGLLHTLGAIVIDEADFMLSGGSGHERALKSMLQITSKLPDIQHYVVGATLPPYTANYLQSVFPDLISIKGTNSISMNVTRSYIRYQGDLIPLLRDVIVPGERALVFCNTSAMATTVVADCQWLKRTALFSSSISAEDRCLLLDAFNNKTLDILICTDKAARGIDFVDVDHVVELPLALDAMTHLHRVGRTGRGGRQGRSTAFYEESRAALVAALEAAEPGQPVASTFSRKRSFRKKQKKAAAL